MHTGDRKLGVAVGSGVSGGLTEVGHLHEEMAMEKQAPAAARLTTTGCSVFTTRPTLRLDVSPCPSWPAPPANAHRADEGMLRVSRIGAWPASRLMGILGMAGSC